jgi:hypothetical protein
VNAVMESSETTRLPLRRRLDRLRFLQAALRHEGPRSVRSTLNKLIV